MIIEIVSKTGRSMELHAFHKNRVSIGRAYSNDLILQDPYMEAEHLEVFLEADSGCLYVQDRGSVNGTHVLGSNKEIAADIPVTLKPGEILSLGKTHIRVVDEKQSIPSALKLSALEPLFTRLGNWWLTVVAIVILTGQTLLTAYWQNPHSEKLLRELVPVVFLVLLAVCYGTVWVMAARLNKGEGRFLFNANLLLLMLVVDTTFQMLKPVYQYNLGWLFSGKYLMMLLVFIITSLMFYISLTQTLNARRWLAVGFASIVGFLFVLNDLTKVLFPPDFRQAPSYDMTLVAPPYQFRKPVSEEKFLLNVEDSYEVYDQQE